MVQCARLAAAANIQHDRASSAELVAPALLDGAGIGIGWWPIMDPLLKDGRLVALFRDRAIGGAAATGDLSDRESKTKRSKGQKR